MAVKITKAKGGKYNVKPVGKKNWIAGAIKHPGGLHKSLGIPLDQKIPKGKIAAAAKQGGIVGKQARLAQTLSGF